MKIEVRPLTGERWDDLESIFYGKGCSVARGCWCMHYRQTGSQNTPASVAQRGKTYREQLKVLAGADPPAGLIGYQGATPVGWVTFGPREDFLRLKSSPIMKPVDDQPVWSIVCFVVLSPFRRQGVATALLEGCIAYARSRGVSVLEAYPVDKPGPCRDDSLWFGKKSMYDKAGFREVARRKAARPVMRLTLWDGYGNIGL